MLGLDKLVLVLIATQTAVCKKSSNQSSKLLEKESKTRMKVACKRTDNRSLMRLRAEEKTEKLLSCLIRTLQTSSSNSFQWSLLGETYDKIGEKSKANKCYKEAVKMSGKVSKHIKEWDFIGPFTIGKPEVDGDPLEEWGGVKNISKYRWHKDLTLYSELSLHGEVRWERLTAGVGEPVRVSPNINWNDLVMSLQSMGITEWQGWAFGDLVANEDVTLTVQCLAVNTMYMDGVIMNGDVYRRDEFW